MRRPSQWSLPVPSSRVPKAVPRLAAPVIAKIMGIIPVWQVLATTLTLQTAIRGSGRTRFGTGSTNAKKRIDYTNVNSKYGREACALWLVMCSPGSVVPRLTQRLVRGPPVIPS